MDGVRGSLSSSCKYVSGLEFNTASISTNIVSSSSKVNLAFHKIFLRQRLTNFTMISKKPLKKPLGTLKFQIILSCSRKALTFESLNVCSLSDTANAGIPWRPLNLLIVLMSEFPKRFGLIYKWMARVLVQVNTVMYALYMVPSLSYIFLTNTGPVLVWSMPTEVKPRSSLTRKDGRGGAGGVLKHFR